MSQAVTEYRQLLQQLEQQRREFAQRSRRWNLVRTLLFFAAAGSLFAGYVLVPHGLLVTLGWLLLVVFLIAVSLHEQLRDNLLLMRHRRSVLRRLIARCERNWERLPLWQPKDAEIQSLIGQTADGLHGDAVAVADDLDVFGRGSLFQLVSMASLGPGLRCLAAWLIGPAKQATATERHQAAKLLADLRPWRIDFYCEAKRTAAGTADPDRFLNWIQSPSWLQRQRPLAIWAMISPLLSIGLLLALVAAAVLPGTTATSINTIAAALAATVGINLLISTFLLGEVHEIFASALSGRGDVAGYQRMFQMPDSLPDSADVPLLDSIKQEMGDPTTGASAAMRDLNRIAWLASLKQSGGLFLVYLLLQMGGLWDLHLLRRLERWKHQHAQHAPRWFQALGQLEAIASLAALCDENPAWAPPQWSRAKERRLDAKQLGHPLLKDSVRVCNDASVGPQGTLLLVTGSNMSGKSTLLRSLGLNVLLAGAGGPVCAQALSLPDLELATSIRVRDNLGEGVSFYMAELRSLARVVRHAETLDQRRQAAAAAAVDQADDSGPTTLMYLLDEILQGTNSRERQIAVAHVLRHLIDHGAIGAISTHDLELADDPQLQSISHTVHFRETISRDAEGKDQMTFDYQMRQGVSPTTNALRLLEVVGLGKPGA